jgi:hypothetical protein
MGDDRTPVSTLRRGGRMIATRKRDSVLMHYHTEQMKQDDRIALEWGVGLKRRSMVTFRIPRSRRKP